MKTIKNILIAATLICASAVSTMSAQQAAAPEHQWKVALGDTVMIKRDATKYLTGETPSSWVYSKPHTVGQLGTKRFPEGILLFNINSWIGEDDIVPVHPRVPQETKAEPVKEPEVMPKESEAVVIKEEVKEPAKEQVTPAPAPVQPVSEETVQPGTEEAKQEVAPVEEQAPEIKKEQAKGDSIKSKQNFNRGYDRFTIGVRGGATSMLHKVENGKSTMGGEALLDLQYAHYWTKDGRPVDLGIITGLSLGYSLAGMKSSVNYQKTFTDVDGDKILYNITSDEVKESDGQLQLEIPLMFSLLHTNGLFFNAGLRLMLPVYTPYTQKIDKNNTNIDAYFPEVDIHVTNAEVTGALGSDDYKTKGTDNGNKMAFNLLLGAEIGYEWILKNGNSLGLGAYVNYGVYSTFKNNTSDDPLIQVTAPTNISIADVKVLSATKTYAEKLGYFDVGVKLAYHFNFPKKRANIDSKLF